MLNNGNSNNETNPLEGVADGLLASISIISQCSLQLASNLVILGAKATWGVIELVADCTSIVYRVATGKYEYEKQDYYIGESNFSGSLCRSDNSNVIENEYKPAAIDVDYIPVEPFGSCEIPNICKFIENNADNCNTLKAFIGIGENNKQQCVDFFKDGSLLIGGASRWGKTSCLYSILLSLMTRYDCRYLRIVLVDFKEVDLVRLDKYPHVLGDCITDTDRFNSMLAWVEVECKKRAKLLRELDVNNIQDYNNVSSSKLQPVLIVIDEIAQVLVGEKKVTDKIKDRMHKLISKSMAFGVYWIVCTQELSRDTLGKMKINFTQSIGLKCVDKVASDLVIKDGNLEDIKVKGRAKIDNSDGISEFQNYMVEMDDFKGYINHLKSDIM